MDARKYYWYQDGGFVMAVDAVSHHDAAEYIKRNQPRAEYRGYHSASSFPKTACGCVTGRRQEEISANLGRTQE